MKEAEQIVLMLKGVISEAPLEVQAKIKDAAQKLRDIIEANGDEGFVAMSLVAAEVGAKA